MTQRAIAWMLLALFVARPSVAIGADDLTLLVHAPSAPSAHPPLVVLLHGAGADERDMIGLWRDLPGELVVVSPRAPFRDAGRGWRWYRNASRGADIAISRKIVDLIIDTAIKRFDADPRRVFIGGFSQGAVMTYEVALHEPNRFGGAIVLSGTLFPSALAGLRTGTNHTPFFVAHGTADPRIPFASAAAAKASLARLDVPVAFHAYPGMQHETGVAETRDLGAWMRDRIASPADAGR